MKKKNIHNCPYRASAVFILCKETDSISLNKKLITQFGIIEACVLTIFIEVSEWSILNKNDTHGFFKFNNFDLLYQLPINTRILRKIKTDFIKFGLIKTLRRSSPPQSYIKINYDTLFKYLTKSETIKKVVCFGMENPGEISMGRYIYNNININKKIDNNIVINNSNNNRKSLVARRTTQYMPYARRLSRTIRKTKNMEHTLVQLKSWSNEIGKLVEFNKVSIDRVSDALRWYKSNVGGPYVPIVESGKSFRSKFSRLEDAMKRGSPSIGFTTNKVRPRPNQIIRKKLQDHSKAVIDRMLKLFKESEVLIQNCDRNTLSTLLCNLHECIVEVRPDGAMTQTAHSTNILQPDMLISEYVYWLTHEDWIKNISEKVFNNDSKMFRKFLNVFAERIGLNPLTGRYT